MGLVKSESRATATAAASALVVVDEGCCASAISALERAVELETASVSIAMLPARRSLVSYFAPLSGAVSATEVADEGVARAVSAAQRTACELTAGHVDHRVLTGWEPVLDLLATGRYDVLVLACRPRRRTLQALVERAGRVGTALVVAEPAA